MRVKMVFLKPWKYMYYSCLWFTSIYLHLTTGALLRNMHVLSEYLKFRGYLTAMYIHVYNTITHLLPYCLFTYLPIYLFTYLPIYLYRPTDRPTDRPTGRPTDRPYTKKVLTVSIPLIVISWFLRSRPVSKIHFCCWQVAAQLNGNRN